MVLVKPSGSQKKNKRHEQRKGLGGGEVGARGEGGNENN